MEPRKKYSPRGRAVQEFFVSVDFDGTVTDLDITDSVIKEFAVPGWEEIEVLWEDGEIGSRECLSRQMALINTPVRGLLEHVRSMSINESFISFVDFMRSSGIPFGIISDGFQIFIESLLIEAGLQGVPVYANQLIEGENGLKTFFPYTNPACPSGMCKCRTARDLSNLLPIIHIGDGRSDFCIADKAAYVFAKDKLAHYCVSKEIPHTAFSSFASVEDNLRALVQNMLPERPTTPLGLREGNLKYGTS